MFMNEDLLMVYCAGQLVEPKRLQVGDTAWKTVSCPEDRNWLPRRIQSIALQRHPSFEGEF
jgi:hypothetical protein